MLARTELLQKADYDFRAALYVTDLVSRLPYCTKPDMLRRLNEQDRVKWAKFINQIKRIPRAEETNSPSDTDTAPEADEDTDSSSESESLTKRAA